MSPVRKKHLNPPCYKAKERMTTYEQLQAEVCSCTSLEERLPSIVETVRENGLPEEWIDRVTRWSQVATVYLQERAVVLDGLLEHFDLKYRKTHIPPMDCKELEWMLIVEANSNFSLSADSKEKITKFVEAVKTSNAVLLEFLMIDTEGGRQRDSLKGRTPLMIDTEALDPSMKDNWAIRYLNRKYNEEIFSILLKDLRCDPTVEHSRILKHLAGHPLNRTLMERLMKNPHITANFVFREIVSCSNVNKDIVNYLVENYFAGVQLIDTDIDLAIRLKSLPLLNVCLTAFAPTYENLKKACDVAYVPCIDRILQDGRIEQDLSPLFINACRKDRFSVAEVLIRSPNVNPGAENNEALRIASSWGSTEIVELLMKDTSGRVDPSANNFAALKAARGAKHTKIVELLMSDPFALEPLNDFLAPAEPHVRLEPVEPEAGFADIPNGDAGAPDHHYAELPMVPDNVAGGGVLWGQGVGAPPAGAPVAPVAPDNVPAIPVSSLYFFLANLNEQKIFISLIIVSVIGGFSSAYFKF